MEWKILIKNFSAVKLVPVLNYNEDLEKNAANYHLPAWVG
jgi:hypothetical protein